MQFTINIDDNRLWGVGAARAAHAAGLANLNGVPSDDTQFLNWFLSQQLDEWCRRAMPTVIVAGVPQSVTAAQAVVALIGAGVKDDVEGAIAALEAQDAVQGAVARAWYERSNEFQRRHPTLLSLQHALGWTDEFVDGLFVTAATL